MKTIHSIRTTLFSGLGLSMIALILSGLIGCQGDTSTEPPVHLVQNMDEQNRLDPQAKIPGTDEWTMRLPVEGTMTFKANPEDAALHAHLYEGIGASGYANQLPVVDPNGDKFVVNEALLKRGQERYNIFCTPCHDSSGAGNGVVIQRYQNTTEEAEHGKFLPPSFHQEKYRAMPVGQFYAVIKNGFGNMGSYASQINVRDRWAIASYFRVLQVSQNQNLVNIPADKAASHRWEVR